MRSKGRKWLLTGGLAVCGRCGGPMAVGSETKRSVPITVYRCHGDLTPRSCGNVSVGPAEVVEELVVAEVLGRLDNPAMAKRLIEHPDPERAALLGELHDAGADDAPGGRAEGRRRPGLGHLGGPALPGQGPGRRSGAALAALPDPDVELPPAQVVRDSWEELALRQKRAVLERYLEKVVVLPAARPGRPKRGVSRGRTHCRTPGADMAGLSDQELIARLRKEVASYRRRLAEAEAALAKAEARAGELEMAVASQLPVIRGALDRPLPVMYRQAVEQVVAGMERALAAQGQG